MKKSNLLTALLGSAALAVGISANATPVIRLNDGVAPLVEVLDGGVGDSSATAGVVSFNGVVGTAWILNVTTGVGSPFYPDPHLDLNSINASNIGGVGTQLDISLSDSGFTLSSLAGVMDFIGSIGGTTQGMVTWWMYVDDTNALFGTQHLIGMGTNSGPTAFSDSFSSGAFVDGTFSMTLLVRINHGNGLRTSSFDFEGVGRFVPEPGTIALLGIGLLGLAFVRRRKA